MKPCPFCAEQIQEAAIVCRFCHADLATGQPFQPAPPSVVVKTARERAWRPGIAGVLSLVIPGAGQIYKGHPVRGICWLIVVVIGYMALIVPGLVLHFICILLAWAGDPYDDGQDRYGGLDPTRLNLDPHGPGPLIKEGGVGEFVAVMVHPVAAWKRNGGGDRSTLLLIGIVVALIGLASLGSALNLP